jgi:hypothetical protein
VVIFFEQGRLGNQLFQYAFLRTNFKDHVIVFIGDFQVKDFFDVSDSKIFCYRMPRVVRGIIRGFFRFCQFLFPSIFQYHNENDELPRSRFVLSSGFFQNCNFDKSIFNEKIKLKYDLLNKSKSSTAFVHIRTGDYKFFPSKNLPAIISNQGYVNLLEKFPNSVNIEWLIFVDKKERSNYKFEKFIVCYTYGDPVVDFYKMVGCRYGGVLSSSSYSWWVSYFSNIAHTNQAYFVAPLYWLNHRSNYWIPENIETNWINYELSGDKKIT